ncbi:MAG TPA: hypothetical protein VFO85_16995 [Vicinamibacteria bacterium]|nr:hypothetical protein [Vicinamibacteria bacterium]
MEELVARWCPRQAAAPLVRKVPAARPVADTSAALEPPGMPPATQRLVVSPEHAAPRVAAAAAPAPPHPKVEPLSADAYLVRFTASGATRDKLRQVQDLLRHAIPDGDV